MGIVVIEEGHPNGRDLVIGERITPVAGQAYPVRTFAVTKVGEDDLGATMYRYEDCGCRTVLRSGRIKTWPCRISGRETHLGEEATRADLEAMAHHG